MNGLQLVPAKAYLPHMVWHLNNHASHQWPLTYSKCQCHTLTVFLLINHDSVNTGRPVGSFTNSPEEASVYGLILAVNIPPKSSLPHSVGQHFVTSVQLHKSTFTPRHNLTHLWSFHHCSSTNFYHSTAAYKHQVNPTGHMQQSPNKAWGLPAASCRNPPVPLCFSGDTEDPGASRFLRLLL